MTDRQLTIDRFEVRAVEVPLRRPIETSAGAMRTVAAVLVDVVTREGVVGSAYARTYTATVLRTAAKLVEDVAALLEGSDAAPASANTSLRRHFRLLGSDGLVGMAIAAIDMALWDAAAKAAGLPLSRYLGSDKDRVPAYASLGSMTPAAAAAEAEELVARGFRGVKAKVGPDLTQTRAVIHAIRSAVGVDVALMVDYNQALTETEALEHCRALEGEQLFWIEDPTAADDLAAYGPIASEVATPLQLGENLRGPAEVATAIAVRASDQLMFDVQRIGGVTGWLAAARLAAEASLPVSSHAFCEFSRHLLAATPTGLWLEYFDHMEAVVEEPVRVEAGEVVLPDRPGAGLAWDASALARLA